MAAVPVASEVSVLQIIINSGVTISAVGVAIYLIKKWMNAREATEEAIKEDAKRTAKELADKHDKACDEIKRSIGENRNFYERTYYDLKNTYEKLYLDLKKDISEVFELQRIANGRVGKVEQGLAVLKQSHEDRIGKMERVTDKI
jgi:hypothetical protein